MTHWQEIWSFSTANLRVVAEVTPCEDDPADSFDNPQDIEAIREGRLEWFDARVRVLDHDGTELGADYLGGCAYESPEELFRHHASYNSQLTRLRFEHDNVLESIRRNREKGYRSGVEHYRKRAAEIRQRIAEIKKVLANNASLNPPAVYCEYGPSMVLEACREARWTLRRMQALRVRDVGNAS